MNKLGFLSIDVDGIRRRLIDLGVDLQFKDNERTLLSLKRECDGGVLSVHPLLLTHPHAGQMLVDYVRSGGRGGHAPLRTLADTIAAELSACADRRLIAFAPLLDRPMIRMLVRVEHRLAREGIGVCLNDNRRTLISLRQDRGNGLMLSLHFELLRYPNLEADLVRFARNYGHGRYPRLSKAMNEVFARIQERLVRRSEQPEVHEEVVLEGIGPGYDLQAMARHVHATWFAHLPPVRVRWSRDPGSERQLSCIRFGSYRQRPSPEIRLHPRLRQAWVARIFVEHVIHHEYCHHAQACDPKRNEAVHSDRFQRWERSYPHYELARRWERANLDRLLAPQSRHDRERRERFPTPVIGVVEQLRIPFS